MNPHEFVILVQVMSKLNDKDVSSTTTYNTTFTHVKDFLIFYYSQMALTDNKLAKEFKNTVPKPRILMDGIENFEKGEAIQIQKGLFFMVRKKIRLKRKHMFYTYLKERFTTLQINNALI